MSGSLFDKPSTVAVGDVFIDTEVEAQGLPDPRLRMKVVEVDELGMVHLGSAIFDGAHRTVVSEATLARKFRRE